MSLPPPFAPSEASDASTSSSSPAQPPHFASDSDDPSFDLDHVQTSTPRKAGHGARYLHTRSGGRDDDDDEDPLHASDTESLDFNLVDGDIDRGVPSEDAARTTTTPPLTRRSLLQLSQPRDGRDGAPFASSSARLAQSFRRDVRGDLYASSPSTGSSTLVDREEDVTRKAGGFPTAASAGEDDVTVRRARVELSARQDAVLEEFEDDQETARAATAASEDGESSSPRPRRSRVGDLASYVDAKMSSSSTPRRSPKRVRHVPATPAAPGAYPASVRKPASSRPSASSFASTPHRLDFPHPAPAFNGSNVGTPSSQIHDAFSRLITGPDGALAHSAERRAALAAAGRGPSPARTLEPPTPHPVGHYAFVPSTSLPVERSPRRRSSRPGDGEPADELDTPSRPTKLERALRHLSEVQRETAERRGAVEVSSGPEGDEELEREPFADAAAAGRSAIEFAMAHSYRQDVLEDASAEESLTDDADVRASLARRRSATALRTSHSVRFASPPSRRRSPSTSPARSTSPPRPRPSSHRPRPETHRSTTPSVDRPPSPTLPPLPPPLEPDSPEPLRRSKRPELMRRSHSSTTPPAPASVEGPPPPALPPPARTRSLPSPRRDSALLAHSPQSLPDPDPEPAAPAAARGGPYASPPRRPPTREVWSRPQSSTPPRGGGGGDAPVEPPSPASPARIDATDAVAAQGADRSAEYTVQALVEQLAAAVQALTASREAAAAAAAAATGVDQAALTRGRGDDARWGEVERRRVESAARWDEREREVRELEVRAGREAVRPVLSLSLSLCHYPHRATSR